MLVCCFVQGRPVNVVIIIVIFIETLTTYLNQVHKSVLLAYRRHPLQPRCRSRFRCRGRPGTARRV